MSSRSSCFVLPAVMASILAACGGDREETPSSFGPETGSTRDITALIGFKPRESTAGGVYYPTNAFEFKTLMDWIWERAGKPVLKGRPVALIAPHGRLAVSGQAAAYAYKAVAGRDIRRVILIGPSHDYPFKGASIPEFSDYKTTDGLVRVDREALERLRASGAFVSRPEVHAAEHSIEVQLPFLRRILASGDFRIVPILTGSISEGSIEEIAKALRPIVDQRTLIVVSGDWLHYGERFGYAPFGNRPAEKARSLEAQLVETVLRRDAGRFTALIDRTGAPVCAREPIRLLLRLLPEGARGTALREYFSGDLSGDWSASVGFASILFAEGTGQGPLVSFSSAERDTGMLSAVPPEDARRLASAVRSAFESYVRHRMKPDPASIEREGGPSLREKRRVFVRLLSEGKLRGSKGELSGEKTLAHAAVDAVLGAAISDEKHPPVEPEEVSKIEIELSVLGPMTPIGFASDIIPVWQGIYFEREGRFAVLPPQVIAASGWNAEQALGEVSRSAGFDAGAWRIPAVLKVFEVNIIRE